MASFDTFRSEFKGDLVTPSDEGYENAIKRWARNAIKRAAIVAYVKDAEDVSLALKYAKAASLPIAIHSGGHSPAGNSSVEGGLVIDLSRYINTVRVDPEAKLAYVGGGAKWGQFDHATMKHGLAGVAGTVHHTGVGGLIVGGGYGWQSARHGLAIDTLKEVTIVTADGSILTANESQNQDLFWGVRGGGSNFGVVTEFVMRVFPQRSTVYAGAVIFSPDKLEKITEFLDEWWPRATDNEGLTIILTHGPDGSPSIVIFLLYNGTEAEGQAAYKKLLDIGPVVNTSKEMDYLRVNEITNPVSEPDLNYYFKGALLSREAPSKDLNRGIFDKIMDVSKNSDYKAACILEYIPNKKINSVPIDATPYRRDLPGNILITCQWHGDSDEKLQTARTIGRNIAELFINEVGYGNYGADIDSLPAGRATSSAKALFRDHYPKMQALKKKYDPDMVFNRWQPITPA